MYQNIGLAFAVKAVVLVLGAGGLATMWEAVFADVGVALLAILNALWLENADARDQAFNSKNSKPSNDGTVTQGNPTKDIHQTGQPSDNEA